MLRKIVRPLRTLFVTARGTKSVATSVLVKVVLHDGATGLGEVPTSFVMPHETLGAISMILREARTELVGMRIEDYPLWLTGFGQRHYAFHMTLAGLEVALMRAQLCARGVSEWEHWGGCRNTIETDITIPFLPDARKLATWMGYAMQQDFRTYKVKVSGDVDADMTFVKAIREMLAGLQAPYTIRLDGNQGYTDRSCLRMLDRLAKERIDVELFEQPLRKDDFAGMKRLARRSPVPIILDETVCDSDSCRRVADEQLGSGVNIKIAKSGIAESAAILKAARQAGMSLMVGCMTETLVGLSAGIFLAAGTGAFDYIDLDSAHLMFGRRSCDGISGAGRQYTLEGR